MAGCTLAHCPDVHGDEFRTIFEDMTEECGMWEALLVCVSAEVKKQDDLEVEIEDDESDDT
jgi:hypothetical protein